MCAASAKQNNSTRGVVLLALKYKLIATYDISVGNQITEHALNTLVRVIYPFTVGLLVIYNWLWFFALLPLMFVDIHFNFNENKEIEIMEAE